MHGHVPYETFLQQISGFLGSYYLFLALMNAVAALAIWQSGRDKVLFRLPVSNLPFTASMAWLAVSMVFTILAPIAFSGRRDWMEVISLPQVLRSGVNRAMNPTIYSVGSMVFLLILFFLRKYVVQPPVAWALSPCYTRASACGGRTCILPTISRARCSCQSDY